MIPVRHAVRVLLINDNKILLMRVNAMDIDDADGKRNRQFWCTIGGGIDQDETVQNAALRELYEETSLDANAVELGPIVWLSDIHLKLRGTLTQLKEQYIVARTTHHSVRLHAPTTEEQQVVKELRWFMLEDVKRCPDVIFPVLLSDYLPDILADRYPTEPIQLPHEK